jgi:threonine/homoserine/homoserine lactone efflux protein
MSILFLLKGFSGGLVFAVTTVAATVWCLQLGVGRGLAHAWLAAAAIAFGQFLWSALAAATVQMLALEAPMYIAQVRLFSAFVFAYIAVKMMRAAPLDKLPPLAEPALRPVRLAVVTLAVALSMPMRFFGYVGVFLAAGTAVPNFGTDRVWLLAAGAAAGAAAWYGFVGVIAVGLRARVSPTFWGGLMRRQTRLGVFICCGLALIDLLPLWLHALER